MTPSTACPRSLRPVGSAPPGTPCGRVADPAPASVGCAVLARAMMVCRTIWRLLLFLSPATLKTLFFYPMRLPSLDSGRLFSAKIAFRDEPFTQLYAGDFAEPFPPPRRTLLRARRSSLGRAPQRAARPLIPGRARPAPARLRHLRRSRAYAFHAILQ